MGIVLLSHAGIFARILRQSCRTHWFYLDGGAQGVLMRIHSLAPAEAVVRTSAAIKSNQGTPIFTHPLHHPANATLFPAKSAQEPIESPVFL